MENQNIYIEALRFGRSDKGIRLNDLVEHLNKIGIQLTPGQSLSTKTTILINLFRHSFESLDGKSGQESTGEFYYIKPQALAYLLSYESNEQARIDSKKAIRLATWSFWISAILALASILSSIYFR